MCSHGPPLKEKGFFSQLYGGSFHLALCPGASASLSQWSVHEHRLRGQCISSCYPLSLQHRGSKE